MSQTRHRNPRPNRRPGKPNRGDCGRCSIVIARLALFETGILGHPWSGDELRKSLVSSRRWKLISRVRIYLLACQPSFLLLYSEFYKRPCATLRSIVG